MTNQGLIQYLGRAVSLALFVTGLVHIRSGLFGPVLVTVALIIIWFLPTMPRPQDALAPQHLPAVLGPDLLGHLLTGFFIALPFWAGGDAGFSRSGIHVMAIITWPMAIGGLVLVAVAAGNASHWLRIEDDALEVATAWRRQRIRYAEIARIDPWRPQPAALAPRVRPVAGGWRTPDGGWRVDAGARFDGRLSETHRWAKHRCPE